MLDPVFEIEAQALAQIIDELDYFQILKVEAGARPEEIKQAYFRESRAYHPDKFFRLEDGEAKVSIAKIYKRINEAWVVLRDDRKRAKYAQDVAGPDRAKKLRYTEASEEELKRQREEELGKTPQGRRMVQQALLDMDGGRWAQAAQNFRMALMYEKDNAFIQAKLEEANKLASGKK